MVLGPIMLAEDSSSVGFTDSQSLQDVGWGGVGGGGLLLHGHYFLALLIIMHEFERMKRIFCFKIILI